MKRFHGLCWQQRSSAACASMQSGQGLQCPLAIYSKTCVRQPTLKLTLVVDVEKWLSYKGTCHVILLAKLHDMYLYKTHNFFHINHFLKPVSKVTLLHRFYCNWIVKNAPINSKLNHSSRSWSIFPSANHSLTQSLHCSEVHLSQNRRKMSLCHIWTAMAQIS